MTDQPKPGSGADRRPGALFVNLPTGAKLFAILSIALLPFAIIAFFASVQTTRIADQETRSRLRVAATESARALSIELLGDISALRVALDTLGSDPENAPGCARLQGVFAQQFASGTRFAVTAADGSLICGTAIDLPGLEAPDGPGDAATTIIDDRGLAVRIANESGTATATAFFPATFLAEIARPTEFAPPYSAQLTRDGQSITLRELVERTALDRRERLTVALDFDGLALDVSVRAAPITPPTLVTMLLPFIMWFAAAGLSWFIVDRLLIRPLRRLRTTVGTYVPGTTMPDLAAMDAPAQEIRELGATFGRLTETVAEHEENLAQGLVRQTRLTREVHHRVKNNLQVIASLINFHSRGAETREAAQAYASIQRRVDALAVVHRYHYAEMEENRGVELRSVLGELASNIRATAADIDGAPAITLDLDPMMVSQDVAVAAAFLMTEIIELAMAARHPTSISISLKPHASEAGSAVLRASSPSLVSSPDFDHLSTTRYGRVIGGLARQLRAPLHYDPLVGSYEIAISVIG